VDLLPFERRQVACQPRELPAPPKLQSWVATREGGSAWHCTVWAMERMGDSLEGGGERVRARVQAITILFLHFLGLYLGPLRHYHTAAPVPHLLRGQRPSTEPGVVLLNL